MERTALSAHTVDLVDEDDRRCVKSGHLEQNANELQATTALETATQLTQTQNTQHKTTENHQLQRRGKQVANKNDTAPAAWNKNANNSHPKAPFRCPRDTWTSTSLGTCLTPPSDHLH
jgi:hypothetical protein